MKYIVVILRGYASKPKSYESLRKFIEECFPNQTIMVPTPGISAFSVRDPDSIVLNVLKLIDTEWEKQKALNNGSTEKTKIIIIGHSTGAVLARKLYVAACGENAEAPFEKIYPEKMPPKEWAENVDRIILLAGINRGWTLNRHLYTSAAFSMRIGIFLGHIFQFFGLRPLAFKTKRGGSFITQLRIQWLYMLRHYKDQSKKTGGAVTIQLLGTIDDIIPPDDSIDMVTGANFIYLEVPGSGHMSVLEMTNDEAGKKRKDVFKNALMLAADDLVEKQTVPLDNTGFETDESVTDVAFVIHGIRDTGYWTHKLAARIKSEGDKVLREVPFKGNNYKKFATETSSYGYFPMLPFLLSFVRREKVEWLMDQYTEDLAHYPNAEFSFMGHSNGTYLLAKALEEYPSCRFKNVLFAGSVVRKKYKWEEMIAKKRIKKFCNLVASSDWVVAMFPKSFQRLRIQDLGSGGFDGFKSKLGDPYQIKFVPGPHGAATEEKYWNDIANFIVTGEFSNCFNGLSNPNRSLFMKILGATAPIPFLLIIAFVIFLAWCIQGFACSFDLKVLYLFIYFICIWKIVTKF